MFLFRTLRLQAAVLDRHRCESCAESGSMERGVLKQVKLGANRHMGFAHGRKPEHFLRRAESSGVTCSQTCWESDTPDLLPVKRWTPS
jgi:hypothetical protein